MAPDRCHAQPAQAVQAQAIAAADPGPGERIREALALVVMATRAESIGTSEKRLPINEARQFG